MNLLAHVVLVALVFGGSSESLETRFDEKAAELGLDFVHDAGRSGDLHFHEMMGAGVALFDMDGDADLDVYFLQGGSHTRGASQQGPSDRLFRNELLTGRPETLRFVDVTAEAGLSGATTYGMGVATGDVDGDGLTDLFLANFGVNQLWRNRGGGRFEDVSESSGLASEGRWSVAASFVDLDRDGDLDLFVVDYVDYSLASHRRCYAPNSRPDYCGPQSYRPEVDRLYRNRGDGTFEDVSLDMGFLRRPGSGLGVVVTDIDHDGWPDLYVANDQMANHLWINRRGERFDEGALLAGVALSGDGEAEAGMGVVAADFDNDGDEDLFLTHLMGQTNTHYRNDAGGFFLDTTAASGLATGGRDLTGFGVVALDVDLDGWLDLLVVNGSVKVLEKQVAAGSDNPLEQPDLLFMNRGDGRFELAREPALERLGASRGAAAGDVDNDGDVDVVISDNGGSARLLLNRRNPGRRFVGVLATDSRNRPVLGARIGLPGVVTSRQTWRTVRTDGSYASASDPRVLVSVSAGDPVPVTVVWPDGQAEDWRIEPGRYHQLVRGTGASNPRSDAP